MSSILKALRKIEEDKRVDKHAAPDLMSDQGFAPAKPKPFLPLLAGVALGAAIVGLFFLWSPKAKVPVAENQPVRLSDTALSVAEQAQADPDTGQREKSVNSVAIDNPSQKNTLSARSLKDSVESTQVPVVTLPPEPVIVAKTLNATASKPVAAAPKPVVTVSPPKIAETVSGPAKIKQEPQEIVTVTTSNLSSKLPEGVTLLVSEIFYQENSDNSMAVVNDLPVMAGSRIDSAVVDEIRTDSVIFEIDGTFYGVDRSRQ